MRNLILPTLLSGICLVWSCAPNNKQGKDTSNSTRESFVQQLLSQMTLEEKVGQLNQYSSRVEQTGVNQTNQNGKDQLDDIRAGKVGSMLNVIGAELTHEVQKLAVEETRLGIPLLFGYDVIHGFKTMFPIPLAEAASWEPELAYQTSMASAREASSFGIHWAFAPMMDISWDARWGRVMEGAGEDPYLGSAFARKRVMGFQGADLSSSSTIAACAKHFATYGFVQSGLDYNSVDVSESRLRNVILPPFQAAAEAGSASFMNAFNEVNGIPATGHKHLLRDILRDEWGFEGVVLSDWASIGNMAKQGVVPDKKQAAALALEASSDVDMESRSYIENLAELIKSGVLDERLLDESVLRVLRLKYDLGLFDDPYKYGDKTQQDQYPSLQHLVLAREAAKRSIVLLKNENNILPLPKSGKTIAVIGELAADSDSPLGSWRAQAIKYSAVSITGALDSMKINYKYARGSKYLLEPGKFRYELKLNHTDETGIREAVSLARQADVVIMSLGEHCFQSGEGRSQTDIGLKGLQMKLFDEVRKVNPNIVVVLMNGRPLAIPHIAEHSKAILETWHLGSQSGYAITDVLFGDYNPSGKLPMTFPRSLGQVPMSYLNKPSSHSTPSEMVFWSHYTDESTAPLYPFGYGLSYTSFDYGDVMISADTLSSMDTLTVSVTLANTGDRFGEEVVQLYLRDVVSSESRPLKELIGFKKVGLKPGEKNVVTFELSKKDLEYYYVDQEARYAEEGDFQVYVGPNSADGLTGQFYFQSE